MISSIKDTTVHLEALGPIHLRCRSVPKVCHNGIQQREQRMDSRKARRAGKQLFEATREPKGPSPLLVQDRQTPLWRSAHAGLPIVRPAYSPNGRPNNRP
jgi:hypothetical protein